MMYDSTYWHAGQPGFPADAPRAYGATHIGLFLRWCFVRGWIGDGHRANADAATVVAGEMSGTDFLLAHCDGKLTSLDFDAAGNEFAEQYYGSDGLYLVDYCATFAELVYSAPESAHDFTRFTAMIEARIASGRLTKRSLRPWWRFW